MTKRAGALLDQITAKAMWAAVIVILGLGSGAAQLKSDHLAAAVTLIAIAAVLVLMTVAKAARRVYLTRRARRSKIAKYREVLSTLVKDDDRPFIERIEVEYHIGLTEAGDRVVRKASTAAPPGERLHYRWVSERQPNSRLRKPVDPEDVRFTAEIGAPRHSPFVALDSEHGQMRTLVQFVPALGDTPVDWSVAYDWPGMWDPLRAKQVDTATFRLTRSLATWEGLTLSFIFPKTATDVAFIAVPPVGTASPATAVAGEQPRLSWSIDNPPTGAAFEFRFGAKITN